MIRRLTRFAIQHRLGMQRLPRREVALRDQVMCHRLMFQDHQGHDVAARREIGLGTEPPAKIRHVLSGRVVQ